MSITWTDGFDAYASNAHMLARGYVTSPNPSYVTGRLGAGKAIEFNNGTLRWPINNGSTTNVVAAGVAFKTSRVDGNFDVFLFKRAAGGDTAFNLVYTGTGALQAQRDGAVLGTSAAGLISADSWNYIEVEATRHSSAGTFKVYCNGVKVLDLSGVNTGSFDPDICDMHGSTNTLDVDDLYTCNVATRMGEIRIDTVRPSADTATKAWTPSTGTDNYACVDETSISTADFVSTSGVGDKDYYTLADMTFNPANIFAITAYSMAKKDDATARTYRTNISSGGTEGHGTTRGLGTSYAIYADIFELNPNGSVAWTETSVNALQVGIEVVS